jgi:hypothetical protein
MWFCEAWDNKGYALVALGTQKAKTTFTKAKKLGYTS